MVVTKVDRNKLAELINQNPKMGNIKLAKEFNAMPNTIAQIKAVLRKQGKIPPAKRQQRIQKLSPDFELEKYSQYLRDAERALEEAKAEIMKQLVGKMDLSVLRDAVEKARQYPELESERAKYKRGYNNLLEAKQQQTAGKLAYQQGEVTPPLNVDKLLSNLTEHICSETEDLRTLPLCKPWYGAYFYN